MAIQKVTENVYVNTWTREEAPVRGCNSSFVITSEGIVVVDTPYLPTDAVRWRDEIKRRGEVRFVLNTEHHRDHVTGNYFFSATVVSSQGVRAAFGTSLGTPEDVRQRVKEMDPQGFSLVQDYQPRPPAITFSERLTLYTGKHTFELMHLPGHTSGQVGVYVPRERVFFTGDNFANGWQPSLAYACPIEWLESLRKIEALDAEVVVPGHGMVGDKKALRKFRAFLEEYISAVKKAVDRGMSQEEAADTISFESAAYPPALHPGPKSQRDNVMRLYEMLKKG